MENKREQKKKLKKEFFLTSLAMIALGFLFVIFPENSGKMLCYVSGCILLAWGAIKLVLYFLSDEVLFGSYKLVGAVALIMGGLAALLKPTFFAEILPTIFGCVMVVDGVLKLQYGIDLAKAKAEYWWLVLISALIMIALGTFVVFNPMSMVIGLMIFTGVVLIVNGVVDIVVVIYVDNTIKRISQDEKTVYLQESEYTDV